MLSKKACIGIVVKCDIHNTEIIPIKLNTDHNKSEYSLETSRCRVDDGCDIDNYVVGVTS